MRGILVAFAGFCSLFSDTDAEGQGIFVSGVGAINRSMGSTAVAAPLDAAGALNANVASISGLQTSEVEFGLEAAWTDTKVGSAIPALGRSGSTSDDSSVTTIPVFALVEKEKGSPFSYGLGFLGVAGFRVDYPASTSNPILAPQPHGLGRVQGSAGFFQIVPAVSYSLTERTSVGVAPMVTIGHIEADPLVFSAPGPDGIYPPGTDSDYRFGGGFQLGIFHQSESGINVGAAFKSPQWMESFTINTTDRSGLRRLESLHFDLPMIVSVGASYTGLREWVFATDVRYFDYSNATGFRQGGFDSEGALRGLGWDSIFAVSSGVQYRPNERWSFRAGYIFHQKPMANESAFFSVGSPLVIEHVLGLGCSYAFSRSLTLSLTYVHGFENSITGPVVNRVTGAVPGTSVRDSSSADSIGLAVTWRH